MRYAFEYSGLARSFPIAAIEGKDLLSTTEATARRHLCSRQLKIHRDYAISFNRSNRRRIHNRNLVEVDELLFCMELNSY